MPLSRSQARNLRRSRLRAERAGRAWQPQVRAPLVQQPPYYTDDNPATAELPFTTILRRLCNAVDDLHTKLQILGSFPYEPSPLQERADLFVLRQVWQKFRLGFEVAETERSVMWWAFSQWAWHPDGALASSLKRDFVDIASKTSEP